VKEQLEKDKSSDGQNEYESKLSRLFNDTTKYLILFSLPVFLYLFTYSDLIITTWMGKGYELSAFILKIIVLGQLVNMIFSAPGNSITPNIGIPKYQMFEGLINLSINLVLSYFLIKYYKIIGAAYGNTIATSIASFYVFYISAKYFKQKHFNTIFRIYVKPLVIAIVGILISYFIYIIILNYFYSPQNRFQGIIFVLFTGFVYVSVFTFGIFNAHYLNERDYIVIIKTLFKIFPVQSIIRNSTSRQKIQGESGRYNNELISICILTYNRLDFLKKCINSLLKTLKEINFELLIFDNHSDDGTEEFLQNLQNQFNNEGRTDILRIIQSKKNIGTAGKGKIVESAKGDFIVGIDDDVIEFPERWVQNMVYAYKNISFMGYLVADVVQDDKTSGAKQLDKYYNSEYFDNGKIKLLIGPAGGWCFMVSRKVYNEVGKFYFPRNRIFFAEDANYGNRALNKGLKVGILDGLKVYHATGNYYNKNYPVLLENKYSDYNKNNPFLYEFRLRLNKIFSFKRYERKFLDFVIKFNLV
jgi:GT2 family glycosyltransferase